MCLCIIQYTWISFRLSNVILDQTIFFTARTLCHFYINPSEHDKMSILNHSSVVGWKIRHLSGLVKKTAGQTCLLLRAAIHSQRTLQTFPPLLSKRLRNFEKQGGKSGFSQRFSQQQRSPVSFLGSFWWQQRAVIPTLHVPAHCVSLWAHSCTAAQYV